MKLNFTVKATKNYQTIEISATEIEISKYPETKMWMMREAQICIDQFVPGENVTQVTTSGTPRRTVKPASEKQLSYLRRITNNDPNIDFDNLTAREASDLLDLYSKK